MGLKALSVCGFKRENGMSGKNKLALLVLGLTFVLIAISVYCGYIGWLEQKRKSPYRQAGLSEKQINPVHACPSKAE